MVAVFLGLKTQKEPNEHYTNMMKKIFKDTPMVCEALGTPYGAAIVGTAEVLLEKTSAGWPAIRRHSVLNGDPDTNCLCAILFTVST
jgi:hypothetical protein